MAHFAEIDENGIVIRVLVVSQEFIDTGALGDPSKWIQTSYNTYDGVHTLGGTPLRKNYAGVGYKYDSVRDAFIPPQKYASWTLDEQKCRYMPPVEYPKDTKGYTWDEATTNWVESETSKANPK